MKFELMTEPKGKVREQNLKRAFYNKLVKYGIEHKEVICRKTDEGMIWEVSGSPKGYEITDCMNDLVTMSQKPYFGSKYGMKVVWCKRYVYNKESYTGREGDIFHFSEDSTITLADGNRYRVHTKFSVKKWKGVLCDIETGEQVDISPYTTKIED